MMQIIIIPSGV